MRPRLATRPAPRRGFALLVTITLLAFLVLLLVSLASLTRVETQVASNNQDQARARQHALMALNIALGELQKYTGPDQRTTARSDMDAALAHTAAASGRWLGAYGNAAEADYAMIPSAVSTAVVAASDSRGSQARLLNWLVSGNEDTAFDPADATQVGPAGNIVAPPPSPRFLPTGAVAGLSASVEALADTITLKDKNSADRPARLLVGPGTVGDAVTDYVVAPLREIPAEAPGMGSDPVPIGRYAWWVGDEGAKARVNLPLATAAQAPNAFVSAPRAAVELVDAVNPSSVTSLASAQMLDPAGTLSRYDPASPAIGRLLSPGQLPLVSPSAAAPLATAARYRWHDLGAWSRSVLADAYAGGLKQDLSALLADLSPAAHASPHADTDFIFPPEPNTPTDTRNQYGLPTWGQLRSFAQTTSAAGELPPREPGMVKTADYTQPVGTTVGVAPVMTYAALGFQYCAPAGDAVGNAIHLAVFPIVVLWNPYTAALQPAKYKIGLHRTEYGRVELQGHDGPEDSSYPWSAANIIETKDLTRATSATDPFFRFVLDAQDGIPAGASRVFTLKANGSGYDGANELQARDYNQFYHALLPSTASIGGGPGSSTARPVAAGGTYRVGVNGHATRTTYSGRATSKTFFGTPETISYAWSVAGKTEAYLAAEQGDWPRPANMTPYQGATPASRKWYQALSYLSNPQADYAPYGPNVGYASDPLAQTVYPGSHPNPAEAGKWRGLLQSPGPLGPAGAPAWRMVVHARFDQSNTRWLVGNNPRALQTTNMKGRSPANFTGSDYGETTWPPRLNVEPDDSGHPVTSAGFSPATTTAITDATLFEFRPGDRPLLSLGQFQHASLAWYGAYPAYAIGNSNGDVSLASYGSTPAQIVRLASQSTDTTYTDSSFSAYYDLSWLLNRALWDRYYVSTVPHPGTGVATDTAATAVPDPLPNPRHVRHGAPSDADLKSAGSSAHLLLAGGFNVNSTSEQAWRAVLGAGNRLSHDPTGASIGGGAHAGPVYSRFSRPTTNAGSQPWLGYRRLDEVQIAALARNLVAEIRARGPFVSLADFVNRRLSHSDAFPQPRDPRLKGALQAALDAATTGPEAINDASAAPFDTVVTGSGTTNAFSFGDAAGAAPYSSPSAHAPQFLTQADILSALGPGLAARSDTFVIRAYGETLNPADSAQIAGRAWCEAVVQRLPDYITGETAALHPASASPAARQFGRRYQIVSFRWLTSHDI